jgi:hypothetical protein
MKERESVFRVGTSGWSYPTSGEGSWNGVFYPLGKVDELQYDAEAFIPLDEIMNAYRDSYIEVLYKEKT